MSISTAAQCLTGIMPSNGKSIRLPKKMFSSGPSDFWNSWLVRGTWEVRYRIWRRMPIFSGSRNIHYYGCRQLYIHVVRIRFKHVVYVRTLMNDDTPHITHIAIVHGTWKNEKKKKRQAKIYCLTIADVCMDSKRNYANWIYISFIPYVWNVCISSISHIYAVPYVAYTYCTLLYVFHMKEF